MPFVRLKNLTSRDAEHIRVLDYLSDVTRTNSTTSSSGLKKYAAVVLIQAISNPQRPTSSGT
ncbi:MAG: hypothetical protein WBG50_16465 [Desulfomonilaceae bacterium]